MVTFNSSFTFDTVRVDSSLQEILSSGCGSLPLKDTNKTFSNDFPFLFRVTLSLKGIQELISGVHNLQTQMTEDL